MPDAEVVTLGEAMHLFVAEPGVPLERAGAFRAGIAGAETNVAIGLARLGHAVRWLGRLGADASGRAVLGILRAEGVDVTAVSLDPDRPTGLLLRSSHPSGCVEVQYVRAGSAATALDERYVHAQHLDGVRVVHVSGITPMLSPGAAAATSALLDAARASGAAVSFDVNVRRKLGPPERWRAVVGPLLARADLVFAGWDELDLVLGPDAAAELLRGRATSVVIKERDRSCTVTTPDGQWRQPTLATAVVDPIGAGDALVAGYLHGYLAGEPAPVALRAGVACAAHAVGSVGDIDGLPGIAALTRLSGAIEEADR